MGYVFIKIDFKLNILENTPNYLIYRDILRHQCSQKQGTVSTKTRIDVRGGGVIFGPKPKTTSLKLNKKERNLALQTLLYNKRNNITIIGELESLIDEPKTQVFRNTCQRYTRNIDQKILLIVSKKNNFFKIIHTKFKQY